MTEQSETHTETVVIVHKAGGDVTLRVDGVTSAGLDVEVVAGGDYPELVRVADATTDVLPWREFVARIRDGTAGIYDMRPTEVDDIAD